VRRSSALALLVALVALGVGACGAAGPDSKGPPPPEKEYPSGGTPIVIGGPEPKALRESAPEPADAAPPPDAGALDAGLDAGPARAATCAEVIDHALALLRESDEWKNMSPDERNMVEQMLAQMRGEMIKECESKPWPEAVRACVMAAKTADELKRCPQP
jgi:hypothetical protein